MKNIFQGIFLSFISLLILFALLEAGFRLYGFLPYKPATEQMKGTKMEPRPLFNPDSITGYKMDSGTYKIYYEDNSYWQTTNNRLGFRITSTDTALMNDLSKPHIDIFGCSFSYGTGLADSQTYPFLLQQRVHDFKVNNYAVPGHGMAQNFVRMTSQVSIDSGAIIVYAYIVGHDYKTNNANRKKMYPSRNLLKDYFYLYLTEQLEVVRTKYDYSPWPLIGHSAFINFLEDQYLIYLDDIESKHRASKKAVTYLNELCKKKGAHFIFIILTNDEPCKDLLLYCEQNNILCSDVSVDNSLAKYNQMPYDEHPNFEANKLFCEKLYNALIDNKYITQ